MELRHLRYFVAVAEERHFSRAAARLHVAQPPLSQQIKQLEEELGTRLLERTTRRVDLTPAGELLLERAQALLADVEQLEHDVRLVGDGAAGVLRVGVVGSATYRMMPRIVSAAREQMPGLKMHVTAEKLTPQLTRELVENHIDLAILRPPVRSDDIELRHLEKDELLVALHSSHPLAARDTIDLADLADQPFVSFPQESAVGTIAVEAAHQAGFRPRVVQEATETSTLLSFVASGMGVALVPVTRGTFALEGVELRPLTQAPVVDLAIAWRKDNRSALIERFISLFDLKDHG